MCNDNSCPRAGQCYRFTANVNELYQSYFISSPLKDDKSCDEFWLDERHKILKGSK
jgi:hypothetical protein